MCCTQVLRWPFSVPMTLHPWVTLERPLGGYPGRTKTSRPSIPRASKTSNAGDRPRVIECLGKSQPRSITQ
ncbi:hypothetical protein PspLS_03579 [Pyricularia sp. CBS 133598]|nr:hypothetical protein PspLS_03579 [Pyricularia sp. CBS 133598]